MLASIRSIISFFLVIIPVLFLIPHAASSLPIILLHRTTDRDSSAFGPRPIDGAIIFNIGFRLAVFFALFGTRLWATNRMMVIRLVTRISPPIPIDRPLSSYDLNFTALLRAVATPFLNADAAAGRYFAPRRGGSSGPVSSAPRLRFQWARQRGGPAMRGSPRRTGNLPISLASIV